jgi:hypothetical protein
LVGEGSRRSVKLCEVSGELPIDRLRLVLKDADGIGLPEQHRHVGVAASVDSGMDAVTEAAPMIGIFGSILFQLSVFILVRISFGVIPTACHSVFGDREAFVSKQSLTLFVATGAIGPGCRCCRSPREAQA